MAKPRKFLARILSILQQKSATSPEICQITKKSRKVVRQNLRIAEEENLVKQDSIHRFHLTPLGRSMINSVQTPVESILFAVYPQVVFPFADPYDKPFARCTLFIKGANRIKNLDNEDQDYFDRFVATPGYGLEENATPIKAAAAALVDAILDLKAKDIGLSSMLESQWWKQVTRINFEDMPPRYDEMKRSLTLAAKTTFNVLIEFDARSSVEKIKAENIEKKVEDSYKFYRAGLEERRSMHYKDKIDWVVKTTIGSEDLLEKELAAHRLFGTKRELEEFLNNSFDKYFIGKEKAQTKNIIKKAFKSGLFEQEKRTFNYLKVNKRKIWEFHRSL